MIIPLDLLEYDQAHHAAMVRAFGGLVIARDDDTAAKLVTQHKLACITMDGKISRPGSMQVCVFWLFFLFAKLCSLVSR